MSVTQPALSLIAGADLKRCNQGRKWGCGLLKLRSEFPPRSDKKDGTCNICRECMRKATAARYEADKARRNANSFNWYHKNRTLARERNLVKATANPKTDMIHRSRRRAREIGVPFGLTERDILLPVCCPVLGIPLDYTFGDKIWGRDNSPSLDRIVPTLGYVPGNVMVISMRANKLKSDGTADEIEKVLMYVRLFT